MITCRASVPPDQALRLRAIPPLARGDDGSDRQPEGIYGRMDLCPLSHMQACVAVQWSDRLWSGQYRQLQPPFCEVASAWVLQMVASTSTYPKPRSARNALKRRAQTPAIVLCRNREGSVRQLPGSGGKSRHGLAPRASHKIASRNNRLSVPVLPRSTCLRGTKGAMIAYCLSFSEREEIALSRGIGKGI